METTGTVGYAAMFEQFHPTDLLKWCKRAEESGFSSVMASDHFHPWTPEQGESAFVWSWMGALGATTNLRFGTGVTPPGFRYHPAIIAQAAATLEAMYPRASPPRRGPPLPPRHHRPGGGDAGGDVPRPLLARPGRGGGPQRAHSRRVLARGPDPAAPPHGGHRGDPPACHWHGA